MVVRVDAGALLRLPRLPLRWDLVVCAFSRDSSVTPLAEPRAPDRSFTVLSCHCAPPCTRPSGVTGHATLAVREAYAGGIRVLLLHPECTPCRASECVKEAARKQPPAGGPALRTGWWAMCARVPSGWWGQGSWDPSPGRTSPGMVSRDTTRHRGPRRIAGCGGGRLQCRGLPRRGGVHARQPSLGDGRRKW